MKQRAKASPGRDHVPYSSPREILAAALPHERKRELLEEWAYDLRELGVATEEGMGMRDESAMLTEVQEALRELEGGRLPRIDHGPTKQALLTSSWTGSAAWAT